MTATTFETLRRSALNLLARREYSRAELRHRLTRLSEDVLLLDRLLDQLEQQQLLSESRFVDMLVRSHINRGYGPAKIRQVLGQKGIGADAAALALDAMDIDWPARAEAVRQKKFGGNRPEDYREKNRQRRFLQYRGFPLDVITAVL